MGSTPHRQRRARARRRLRAQRPRSAARQSVSLRAGLRRLHESRHLWHDHPGRAHQQCGSVSTSTTGFVKWTTEDSTDLDYSPMPLIARNNDEEDFQFTQEVRLAAATPKKLSDSATLQMADGRLPVHAGLSPGRGQHARTVRALAVCRSARQPVFAGLGSGRLRPRRLRPGHGDVQGKARRRRRRARRLREQERGSRRRSSTRRSHRATRRCRKTAFRTSRRSSRRRIGCSPTRWCTERSANGFKAGGFNPASPPGSESYGDENTWNYRSRREDALRQRPCRRERRRLLHRLGRPAAERSESERARASSTSRTSATRRARALSSNSPPGPHQASTSSGLLVIRTPPSAPAAFRAGSTSSGNDIPNTPDYTVGFGIQYGRARTSATTSWPRRRRVLRRVQVRRSEHSRGRTRSRRELPPGGHGPAAHRRSWSAQRVRHALHSVRVPVSRPRTVGFRRRDGRAADHHVRRGCTDSERPERTSEVASARLRRSALTPTPISVSSSARAVDQLERLDQRRRRGGRHARDAARADTGPRTHHRAHAPRSATRSRGVRQHQPVGDPPWSRHLPARRARVRSRRSSRRPPPS